MEGFGRGVKAPRFFNGIKIFGRRQLCRRGISCYIEKDTEELQTKGEEKCQSLESSAQWKRKLQP